MATLYQIDNEILNCIDAETGEIIDAEALAELSMQREIKIENIACWIKNLVSDAAEYKAEKEAFAEREKKATAKAEKLKNYLTAVLAGEKFSTRRCEVSFRRSTRVGIIDAAAIPESYTARKVKVEVSPDKDAIKAAIKSGATVPGCELVESLNISIK